MSNTRYGHSNVGGGNQDQAERNDAGWTSRQGGEQSSKPGRRGEKPTQAESGDDRPTAPPQGTNTQGELAGIGEASAKSAARQDPVSERAEHGDDGEPSEGENAGSAPGVGMNAQNVGAVHQGVREEREP